MVLYMHFHVSFMHIRLDNCHYYYCTRVLVLLVIATRSWGIIYHRCYCYICMCGSVCLLVLEDIVNRTTITAKIPKKKKGNYKDISE